MLPLGRQRHARLRSAKPEGKLPNRVTHLSSSPNRIQVSSQLRPRRDDRSPRQAPRRTAGPRDRRPTRGGSRRVKRPGRRPSLAPRYRVAATVCWRRRRRAFFRKEGHTCPRGTSRAPRARRGPPARRTPAGGTSTAASQARRRICLLAAAATSHGRS